MEIIHPMNKEYIIQFANATAHVTGCVSEG